MLEEGECGVELNFESPFGIDKFTRQRGGCINITSRPASGGLSILILILIAH
jgi:hypothetical protein